MSGECEKCSEHCLDCKCATLNSGKVPIEIPTLITCFSPEFIARIEKMETEIDELYKLIERLEKRFDEHLDFENE